MSDDEEMTFFKLVDAVSDAAFDCGEHDGEQPQYGRLLDRLAEAKQNLFRFVQKAQGEP